MDKKIQIRESQAFIVIILIMGLVLVGLTFTLLMEPTSILYNRAHDGENVQEDVYQNFFTQTRTIWVWLPLIVVFALIMWGLIEAHKRQGGIYG